MPPTVASVSPRTDTWKQVRDCVLEILHGSPAYASAPHAEEWQDAMQFGAWAVARRSLMQMEAITLLGLLREPPHGYDLAEVYYRLAGLSRMVHMPMRTELARIHAAVREAGVSPEEFSDDPFSRPGAQPDQPARHQHEPHRRIRREA